MNNWIIQVEQEIKLAEDRLAEVVAVTTSDAYSPRFRAAQTVETLKELLKRIRLEAARNKRSIQEAYIAGLEHANAERHVIAGANDILRQIEDEIAWHENEA